MCNYYTKEVHRTEPKELIKETLEGGVREAFGKLSQNNKLRLARSRCKSWVGGATERMENVPGKLPSMGKSNRGLSGGRRLYKESKELNFL